MKIYFWLTFTRPSKGILKALIFLFLNNEIEQYIHKLPKDKNTTVYIVLRRRAYGKCRLKSPAWIRLPKLIQF